MSTTGRIAIALGMRLQPDQAQGGLAYAGQAPVPRPFLMILEWVRMAQGWKMATDIALPIPQPQPK